MDACIRCWLFCIRPAAQDDVAGTVDGAVDDFFLGEGGIHHIAVPGIDGHMVDVQVTVVHPEGVEYQITGGKAVIGYGKAALCNVPCLRCCCVGAAMLQGDP